MTKDLHIFTEADLIFSFQVKMVTIEKLTFDLKPRVHDDDFQPSILFHNGNVLEHSGYSTSLVNSFNRYRNRKSFDTLDKSHYCGR